MQSGEKNFTTNRNLSIITRKSIKLYVWSSSLHAVKVEVIWSRTLWTGGDGNMVAVDDDEVPLSHKWERADMVGVSRQLMKEVRRGQMVFLVHVLRRKAWLYPRIVEGNRGRGRPREKYLDRLVRSMRSIIKPVQLLQAAGHRARWRSFIADSLNDMAQRWIELKSKRNTNLETYSW